MESHRRKLIQNSFMRFIRLVFALVLIVTLNQGLKSQDDVFGLSYEDFIAMVLEHHPVSKQAGLRSKWAKSKNLFAKGLLDPIIQSSWDSKDFKSKEYYNNLTAKIKVPTVYGLHIVGGYDRAIGDFVNPQLTTDENGLWNLGVQLDVLQGLITNERKIALRKAEVFRNLAQNERNLLLLDLIYEASEQFFLWHQYYENQVALEENRQQSVRYFENTKEAYFNGEKTAMDTLESLLSLQEMDVLLLKNSATLSKYKQSIENYLWLNDQPVVLEAFVTPTLLKVLSPKDFRIDEAMLSNHPKVRIKQNKVNELKLDLKLNNEKLKPNLKLNYNPLLATKESSLTLVYNTEYYKLGVSFYMPVFLRKERAKIAETKIKIQSLGFQINDEINRLKNKVDASIQRYDIMNAQVQKMEENVGGYLKLLDGERTKFQLGESSVFILNKRQEKLIESRIKAIEGQLNLRLEWLDVMYYSNRLLDLHLESRD